MEKKGEPFYKKDIQEEDLIKEILKVKILINF